ncbi:MAG: MobF family relaxase, partial [Propionibacteriaceae bacterium]|nr:MobF family relaxase [Propionibacteriaceae bacterium]
MSVHKLSAGDGYLYLLRSTANHDLDDPAAPDLGSYYSEKGESPGRWMGRGVAGLADIGGSLSVGDVVTEAHMKALFGEGLHPEADAIYDDLVAQGVAPREANRKVRLGRAFRAVEADPSGFRQLLAIGYDRMRRELGGVDSLTDEQMAQVRDRIGRERFVEDVGRQPLDAAELSGYIARRMRPDPVPVAGYDLTFSPVKSVSALWSIAPDDVAETIRQAHRDAVEDVMGWLQDEVIYTRRGDNGIRVVDTKGVLATAFEHRDSRAGDPDLHTHVAIANRVQDA